MSDDDKPTGINVVRLNLPVSELKQALSEYRRTLPELIEFHKIEAEIWRHKYKALVDQGFTVAEALQLCSK